MQRKFITNLVLLILLNVLVKPFWIFGIDRTVQNVVGAESYGFYFSLINFSFLLNIILDLGITNYNNRNISQNEQLLTKHLSSIIILRLLLALVYFAISFIVALIIGYDANQMQMLLILVFNQFVLSFILSLLSSFVWPVNHSSRARCENRNISPVSYGAVFGAAANTAICGISTCAAFVSVS